MGKIIIVRERGTEDPVNARKALKFSEFIPVNPFPEPLSGHGRLLKVPG